MRSDETHPIFSEQFVEELAKANGYLAVLGPISAMFSTVIRTIRNAEIEGKLSQSEIDQLACNSAQFLVNVSPTLKAVFYRAAEQLHSDLHFDPSKLGTRALLSIFRAREISTILALAYFYRQIKRKLEPSVWNTYVERLHIQVQISGLIGQTINHVGYEYGMLSAGLTGLGLICFATTDQKGLNTYLRQNEKKQILFDKSNERKRWGTTSQALAAQMALGIGFGMRIAQNILFDYSKNPLNEMESVRAEELLCWHVSRELSESFQAIGEAPKNHEFVDLIELPEKDSQELANKIEAIKKDADNEHWLAASPNDLPPEVIEALEIKPASSSAPNANDKQDASLDDES